MARMPEVAQYPIIGDEAMTAYEFKNAVDAVMALAAHGNNLIQANAPWKLVKTDPAAAAQVIAPEIAKRLQGFSPFPDAPVRLGRTRRYAWDAEVISVPASVDPDQARSPSNTGG